MRPTDVGEWDHIGRLGTSKLPQKVANFNGKNRAGPAALNGIVKNMLHVVPVYQYYKIHL